MISIPLGVMKFEEALKMGLDFDAFSPDLDEDDEDACEIGDFEEGNDDEDDDDEEDSLFDEEAEYKHDSTNILTAFEGVTK